MQVHVLYVRASAHGVFYIECTVGVMYKMYVNVHGMLLAVLNLDGELTGGSD